MKCFILPLTLIVSLFLLSSCGDSDDGSDGLQQEEQLPTPGSKSLFSNWRRADGVTLDLRNSQFNRSEPFTVFFNLGSTCRCLMNISGSEIAGTFKLSACSWNFDGPNDPGCFAQEGTTSFNKAGNFLRWSCNLNGTPASCGVYH